MQNRNVKCKKHYKPPLIPLLRKEGKEKRSHPLLTKEGQGRWILFEF